MIKIISYLLNAYKEMALQKWQSIDPKGLQEAKRELKTILQEIEVADSEIPESEVLEAQREFNAKLAKIDISKFIESIEDFGREADSFHYAHLVEWEYIEDDKIEEVSHDILKELAITKLTVFQVLS